VIDSELTDKGGLMLVNHTEENL